MPFVEDPAHLSKSRLKSDLVAHNVALPPAASKKEVYVELHVKHVDQKRAADFSSDEEDQHVAEDGAEGGDVIDLRCLTDDDLRATLLKYGFKAGPIVASTRALYEKNLRNLLLSEGYEPENGKNIAVTYSDSEEEGEEEEEEEEEEAKEDEKVDQEDEESGSEETPDKLEEDQLESMESSEIGAYFYPQCFSLSSQLRAATSRNKESNSMKNSRNALKSPEQTRSNSVQTPVGITRASSINQRAGLASGASSGSPDVSEGHSSFTETFSITEMVEKMESRASPSTRSSTQRKLNESNMQENWQRSNRLDRPVMKTYEMRSETIHYTRLLPQKSHTKNPTKDILKDIFPDTRATPTGIHVTCRKPIKGAAQRPVQYEYPDTPVSPATFERREVERRLVPMRIRILVFLFLVFILYFIHINI